MSNPVYVALDTPDLARAERIARAVAPHVGGLKLGLEFFMANGPEGVRRIAGLGAPVFLDVKLHDIPNTVAGAMRALSPLGVGAAIVLFFHFVMVYWLVLPYFGGQLPVAERPGLSPSLLDLACLAAVGGLYFTAVFYRMTQHPIIPVKDPRLARSLHFVNA